MMIPAVERPIPSVTDAQFTPALAAGEARRASELHQAGTLRDLYFRADQSSAVLVLECGDVATGREILASLPLVAHGLTEFEVLPQRAYPDFERLFAPGALSSERR